MWNLNAQSEFNVSGDYTGFLTAKLRLKLHITTTPDGLLKGTLDSIDERANGLACADFRIDGGDTLSFRVPSVNAIWRGTVSGDGKLLSGTWDQGVPMPLSFSRDAFLQAEEPSIVDGIWVGIVRTGSRSLRAQIKVKRHHSGREFCTFDSLDQAEVDWDCESVSLSGSDFSFEVPKVRGRWSGKLSSDRQTLTGYWIQGATYALNFSRQNAAQTASPRGTNGVMPPLKAADLESVLDRDLAAARTPVFRPGPLAEGTGGGVVIGVIQNSVRRIFAFGSARADSIFEIGSISKTFTGLLLARLVAEGKVRFEEPVRELLPEGTVSKPETAEITPLDLATQYSGLPRMPDNFRPVDPLDPYADYRAADLYRFLSTRGVAKPVTPEFLYSNLGFGLLGQALAHRTGKSYGALLEQQIAGPLGLKDTVVSLSQEQQARFAPGYDADRRPAHAWNFDALAGAGGIRSTASDMLIYLEAHLHPEKFPALAPAIAQTRELRRSAVGGMQIGLAWLYVEKEGFYWHNGGTGGFSSYAFFDPDADCAAVVLFNTTVSPESSFADILGTYVRQRLAGKATVSLTLSTRPC